MTGNDAVIANDRTIHNGRVNADQTIVTDSGPVNGAVVGDRTIGTNLRGHVGDVDHGEVLDVGVGAYFDMVCFCTHDDLGPDRYPFFEANIAIQLGTRRLPNCLTHLHSPDERLTPCCWFACVCCS